MRRPARRRGRARGPCRRRRGWCGSAATACRRWALSARVVA